MVRTLDVQGWRGVALGLGLALWGLGPWGGVTARAQSAPAAARGQTRTARGAAAAADNKAGGNQAADNKAPDGFPERPDGPAAEAPRKPRVRLPAYYSQVIDAEQRDVIYEIQERYEDQIEKLRAEIAKLEEVRDQEVAAVLTDDQRARVDELSLTARERRQRAAEERKAQQTPDAAAEPAGGGQ